MAQASWSGKLQIDGGQSLTLNNTVTLGGSASLYATLAASDGTVAQVQSLAFPASVQMLAIHAESYPTGVAPDTSDTLQLIFKVDTGSPTSVDLTGDLLIANASVLKAILPNCDSVEVSSKRKQEVKVQLLAVWNL